MPGIECTNQDGPVISLQEPISTVPGHKHFQNKERRKTREYKTQGCCNKWVNDCGLENEVICPNMPLNAVSVWNIVEMRLLEAQKKAEERYSNSYEINGFMREHFYSFIQIYTDPIEQKVGIGVNNPRFKRKISLRLSDKLSVYSAALTAIIVGLQWVEQIKPNRIVICSDSSSALKSMKSTKTDVSGDLYITVQTDSREYNCILLWGTGTYRDSRE